MLSIEQGINFVKFIWVYTNPVHKFNVLDCKVENATNNISTKGKTRLARMYLAFYLPITFLVIWLTYTELLATVKTLSEITAGSCKDGFGDCYDATLVNYVKQNKFSIKSFIEVSFLMVGVIVGNIGWDYAAKIKESGFNVLHNAMSTPTVILFTSFLITAISKDYLPNNIDFEYSYTYRLGVWIVMLCVFSGVHLGYLKHKKSLNKAFKSDS